LTADVPAKLVVWAPRLLIGRGVFICGPAPAADALVKVDSKKFAVAAVAPPIQSLMSVLE
jgi:hypothetical protein